MTAVGAFRSFCAILGGRCLHVGETQGGLVRILVKTQRL